MDGRNVGGPNFGSGGRPKLVRSGISLQRDDTSASTGDSISDQGAPSGSGAVGKDHPQGSSVTSAENKTALLTTGTVGTRVLSIGSLQKSAKLGTLSNLPVSVKEKQSEVPTEGIKATMSEGLSSLVSYSSSSAEASGSEDNSQDAQDVPPIEKASSKLSDQTSEDLMKKIQEITKAQESSKQVCDKANESNTTGKSLVGVQSVSSSKPAESDSKSVGEVKSSKPAESDAKSVREVHSSKPAESDVKSVREVQSSKPAESDVKSVIKVQSSKPAESDVKSVREVQSSKPAESDVKSVREVQSSKPVESDVKSVREGQSSKPVESEVKSVREVQCSKPGESYIKSVREVQSSNPVESDVKSVREVQSSKPAESDVKSVREVQSSKPAESDVKSVREVQSIKPAESDVKSVREVQSSKPAESDAKSVEIQNRKLVESVDLKDGKEKGFAEKVDKSMDRCAIKEKSESLVKDDTSVNKRKLESWFESQKKVAVPSSILGVSMTEIMEVPTAQKEKVAKTEPSKFQESTTQPKCEAQVNPQTKTKDISVKKDESSDLPSSLISVKGVKKAQPDAQTISTVTPVIMETLKEDKCNIFFKEAVNKDTLSSTAKTSADSILLPSVNEHEINLSTPISENVGSLVADDFLDPVEEQLKLLTEGPPISDVDAAVIEDDESLSCLMSESLPDTPLLQETQKIPMILGSESKPIAAAGDQLKSQPTVFTGQVEKKAVEELIQKEKCEANTVKEAEVNILKETEADILKVGKVLGAELTSCITDAPMEVPEVDEAMLLSAMERNVSESPSLSSASDEGKDTPDASVQMVEKQKPLEPSDKSVKRGFVDDGSSASLDGEDEEPKEKRLKLESILSIHTGATPQKITEQPKTEVERMEVDTSAPSKEVLPTFEKLSEDLAASRVLEAEEDEESKNDIDESSVAFKESGEDDKGKEDDKDDEMLTPAARRKRAKKKSYERPRGEGGKFRKEKPDASLLDEDTRMEGNLPQDEDSQGSVKREVRRFRCEVIVPESTEAFTAEKVVEYVWPLEGCGEHYFIQEQISQYLGIMSFKRKYPDLRRRPLEMQERDFLKDKGLVSEMACDLGLTAVRSEDVLDVMMSDFPSKFEELQRHLREQKENEIKERGKVTYSMATLDKSKMQEYLVKAAEDSARWNAAFNREKREDRRYSFDLQTFSLQMPSGRHKKLPPDATKISAYPVAVLPGQYTDYYREYSAAALKSMPLNTVMATPVTNDSLGSDGAGSESEEEVPAALRPSSDIADTVDAKEVKPEGLPICKVCTGTKAKNKMGKPEPLIICGNCSSASHPTCIDLTLVMVPKIESYNWQCMDCKSCVTCNDPNDEEKMIFCDMCDRGYHIYCVGLRRVPNGRWHCKECAICSSCGSKSPAGCENAKNAEWQHEFKKDKNNKQLRYATTLCVPCDKYWKRRQFCYVCLKVYRSIPEDGMVRCSNCPKYIHREGCSTIYENERFCNNCFKIRNSTALNHSRIIAAAKKKMASGY